MGDALTFDDLHTLFNFLKKLVPAIITVIFSVLQEDNFLSIATLQQTIPQSSLWIFLTLYLFGLFGGVFWLLYYLFGHHDVPIVGRESPFIAIFTDIFDSFRRRGKGEPFTIEKSTIAQIKFIAIIGASFLPYVASFYIRNVVWWNNGGREIYFYVVATIGCIQFLFVARWVLKLMTVLIIAVKDMVKGVVKVIGGKKDG